MSDMFRLHGKVALVTGAARGIGRAIAVGLAEAGADIAALDLLSTQETERDVESLGRSFHGIARDLSGFNASAAWQTIQACAASLGRLDVLVNNAGIIRRAAAMDIKEADWYEVLQVDLSSAFVLAQAAGRHIVEAGHCGKVINVCSMLSFQGGMNVSAYTAAKSGLAGLTRALANEWASLGINVNGIAPGYIATQVTAGIQSNVDRNRAILHRIPAGRWGEPEDVKGAAIFLASGASDYVHGAILPVDGGWLSW